MIRSHTGAVSRILIAIGALLCFCAPPNGTAAEATPADEYEVKAAMLAKVLKLVTWPETKGTGNAAPFVVGVFHSDEMESALTDIGQKSGGIRTGSGQPVLVRRLAGPAGIEQCHAVFIGGDDGKRILAMHQALGNLPVLTVGESAKFMQGGGMIGFLEKDDSVQVQVNLTEAQSHGLSISSRLLRIAAMRGDGTP